MDTASQNGVAKTPTKKVVPSTKKSTPEKGNKPSVTSPVDIQFRKMVEFQEVLSKVDELKAIADRYAKVNATIEDLKGFEVSNGQSVQLTIQDHTNSKMFTSYNTNLLSMLLEILLEKLGDKKQELIDQIIGFEI